MLTYQGLTAFRGSLLPRIPLGTGRLAPTAATAYVWPTETCSIGCAHCNFSSVRKRLAAPGPAMTPEGLIAWLRDARVGKLVLCGGGEPLDEPDFCDQTVGLCGAAGMNLAIYTGGYSFDAPSTPESYVTRWRELLGPRNPSRFWIRLSLDAFHAERVGTAVLADWITTVHDLAPEWRISLRALRVVGDTSLADLAERLQARLSERAGATARLVLPTGKTVQVERMAFILDGRGTPDVLERKGLTLPEPDEQALAGWRDLLGRPGQLGRALSRRLTVGERHVDLEIHADGTVHVLESQAFDARLRMTDYSWTQMRELYHRDPVIHAVGVGGLDLIAAMLRPAIEHGIVPRSISPFSVERIDDPDVLDWLTAAAVSKLNPRLGYPPDVVAMAEAYLSSRGAGLT